MSFFLFPILLIEFLLFVVIITEKISRKTKTTPKQEAVLF
jgi:hypothetical protein